MEIACGKKRIRGRAELPVSCCSRVVSELSLRKICPTLAELQALAKQQFVQPLFGSIAPKNLSAVSISYLPTAITVLYSVYYPKAREDEQGSPCMLGCQASEERAEGCFFFCLSIACMPTTGRKNRRHQRRGE